MKLSEAMTLGHTLIREERMCYLEPKGAAWTDPPYSGPCGCAIGSALAAMGRTRSSDGVRDLHAIWPWTKGQPSLAMRAALMMAAGFPFTPALGPSVADWISAAHCNGAPRLKIAEILARYEPRELPPSSVERVEEAFARDGEAVR